MNGDELLALVERAYCDGYAKGYEHGREQLFPAAGYAWHISDCRRAAERFVQGRSANETTAEGPQGGDCG